MLQRSRLPGVFDVFHSLTHMYGFPPSERVRARARFLTIHDLIPVLFPEYLSRSTVLSNFERLLSSIDLRKDWIICVSESTKRDFCKYTSMSPDRVFVIPEAASRRLFHPVRETRTISATLTRLGVPDENYVLSVCLQEPKKNLPHLIRCFYTLLTERALTGLNLVLVGAKGWRYDEISAAVESAPDLRKRIIFTGPISDEDLRSVYSGAMFFVFPSLYEGFGLPVLEAMQCGAPVITSTLGSLPEIVGAAGILVDPRSERELCEAMDRLARSSSDRSVFRQRGLRRASAFSWSNTVTKTLEAYRTALAHPA
jgi:glycosyltransferase involved in cell wall biosynthesis